MKIVSASLMSCFLVSTTIADDHSVADAVNFDLRAIGQTQGAGVPNAVGLGAFVPLHKTSNAVTYVDIEVKGNVADRSGDSSIINTEVAGTTPSSSARVGYRWINESGQMYGVYAGYDTRELKAGPVDTTVVVTDPRTVDFQQVALGAEFVSNQWRFDVYALIPTGDTEQQLNSHYQGGALDTYGADVGYQINDKTKVSVGYYYQNGDVMEADGGGVSAGLNYDITNNLTAGLKVSYDDAFETRVMATINWSFADLFKGDEAEKEAIANTVMKALNASPEQRDVRVHDGPILWKITVTPEGQKVTAAIRYDISMLCPPPQPQCITSYSECIDMYYANAPCPPAGQPMCYEATGFPCPS